MDIHNEESIYFARNSLDSMKIEVTIEKLGAFNGNFQLFTPNTPSSSAFLPSIKGIISGQSKGSTSQQQTPNALLNKNNLIERTVISWGEIIENNFQKGDTLFDSNQTPKSKIFTSFQILQGNSVDKETTQQSPIIRNRKIKPLDILKNKNLVIDNPTKMQFTEARHINTSKIEMLIFAYLGSSDKVGPKYDKSQEFVLAQITIINGNMIIMRQNFSGTKLFAKDGVYQIHLKVHDVINFSKINDEILSLIEFEYEDDSEKADKNLKALRRNEKLFVDINYMVTIKKASGFARNGSYVEYLVECPDHFRFKNNEKLLIGRTQICYSNKESESLFSFTFELNLQWDLKSKSYSFPLIYFKVGSEDSFKSFYVNGYSTLILIPETGYKHHSLKCWRPVNKSSSYGQLYELFVGQYTDLKCINIQKEQYLNKYESAVGMTTESSGLLEVSVNTVLQSQHFILNDELSSMKYSVMNKIERTDLSLYMNIKRVLLEFEKARKNLLLIST